MLEKEFPIKDSELSFPHAYLIDASAGSGKTHNLALRYIQFLLSEKIEDNSLHNILAVTFTDNATKEMKRRIIDFLKEIYLKAERRKEFLRVLSLNEEKLMNKADEILNSIFYNYADFYVGTIDSFITKIISASADELKVNPEYELIFENRELVDKMMPNFWLYIKNSNKTKILDKFLDTLNTLGGNKFDFLPLNEIKERFAEFLDKENKFLKEIIAIPLDYQKKIDILASKIYKDTLIMKKKYDKLAAPLRQECEKAFNEGNPVKLIKSYDYDSGIFCKRKIFNERIANDNFFVKYHSLVKNDIAQYYEIESSVFFKAYCDLYIIFRRFFEKNSCYYPILSLSNITKNLSFYITRENIPEIYLRLSANFSHFLIDEFQDTSLAQWNIFRPLIENALSMRGSLFLIGDTKQAIYMFRNADYKIMSQFRKKDRNIYLNTASLKKSVELFSIDINYRSDVEILSYVKSFFLSEKFNLYLKEKLGEDLTGLLNCYQVVFNKKNRGYVQTHVFNEKEDDEKEGLKKKFFQIIKDLVLRFDLKDIAVLVNKNDEVEEIVGWLNSIGVPSASFSSLDIRKRKIINEIICFLKFLENPQDNFSFSLFLLSDIFNKVFPKREKIIDLILEYRDSGQLLYVDFKNKYFQIWEEYFEEIFSKTGYCSAYEIISLIYRKFNLYENFYQEQAFLIKFADISFQLILEEGVSSIGDLIKFIESDSKKEDFSISLGSSLNAVQVMTFHKAKGLGFGAVINLFIESKKPFESIYYLDTEKGIELKRIIKSYTEYSENLKSIYADYQKENLVQDLNSLYVALTRPRHELYNLVRIKDNSQSVYSLFENFEAGGKTNFKTGKEKEDFLKIVLNPYHEIYDFIGKGEIGSLETLRGEFYHYIFSKINTLKDFTSENLKRIIKKASIMYFGSDKWEKEALIKVPKILSNKKLLAFFEEKDGRISQNEVEFITKNGKICRIDRLVEDIGNITIIDYKTGKRSNYSLQIDFYKKIIGEYSSKKISALICYVDLEEIEEM